MRIRYIIATEELTGWCGDKKHGDCVHLERGRPTELVVSVDMPVPTGSLGDYLYDEAANSLVEAKS